MSFLDNFTDITRPDEPLAPHTWLKLGGPAQFLVEPRSDEELASVVKYCHERDIDVHLLGGGSNLLIREEGVSGVVLRLTHESFGAISIEDTLVTSGGGALLSTLVSRTVDAGLAGLETLVGIPGTVGGAIHGNAGGRNGDIGPFVRSVDALTNAGQRVTRSEDELIFAYRQSSVNELAILRATFKLNRDNPDEITQRMKKTWIMKKAAQPYSHQSAGCIFKNPRGMSAGSLIEQAGLKGARIGGAEISDRHANFIVTTPDETKSADVLKLIDLVRTKVQEQFGIELELEIEIW